MKNLALTITVLFTTLVSAVAFGQAGTYDVSLPITIDGGGTAGRRFDSARTAFTIPCEIPAIGTYCPREPGYYKIHHGFIPDGRQCCEYIPMAQAEERLEELALENAKSLQEAMDPSRTSTFWGYVSTTNRSPNAGRSVSIDARLDACLSYTNVNNVTDYFACETACLDTNKNGYCQNNNSAVCIDRCQCKYPGNGTCDHL